MWDPISEECIDTLIGHSAKVNSVMFSPNGKWIISASSDSTIRIWNARTGKTKRVLSSHSGSVNSAQYSNDGKYIISASDDSTTRIWSSSGILIKTLKSNSKVKNASFNLSNDRFLINDEKGTDVVFVPRLIVKDNLPRILNQKMRIELFSNNCKFSDNYILSTSFDGVIFFAPNNIGKDCILVRNFSLDDGCPKNITCFDVAGDDFVVAGCEEGEIVFKRVPTLQSLIELTREKYKDPLSDNEKFLLGIDWIE